MSETENRQHVYTALRDLEQDNAALRLKLARHEFRQMERELKSDRPFHLDIFTAETPTPTTIPLPDVDDITLPHLPVPMGSIHAAATVTELPVIGVHDDGLRGADLAAALMGLMNTQYHSPFARLIFLCSSFDAVPFFGRYGFAFEHIGAADPATALARLNGRYGAAQIRSLGTGAVIAKL
jgi:hypothetical protein